MQKEKRKQSNDEEDDSSSRKRRKADLSKPASFISTEPLIKMNRPRHPLWEHVVQVDGDILQCKYCNHSFSKGTSITRIRYHLSGVKGKGVKPCVSIIVEDEEPRGDPSQPTNVSSRISPGEDLVDQRLDTILEDTAYQFDESRGDPLPTSFTVLEEAFKANAGHIRSWIMDDEVSTIGIYGMAGVGKTELLKHIHNDLLQSQDSIHRLYWVQLSKNSSNENSSNEDVSIERLQNLIAKRIGLDLSSEDDDESRSIKLSKQLKLNQRWIIFIDGLWKKFELEAVGIPDKIKGCKLIVSTRSQDVCRMVADRCIIEVKTLSHEEAVSLFMKKLGHNIETYPEKRRIANCIVHVCGGLPLGIKTMAGIMKKWRFDIQWRDALKDLEQSSVGHSDMEIVTESLKLSYDRLKKFSKKQAFLRCALFPKAFMIPKDDLIAYLIDDGVIETKNSREEEFRRGRSLLYSLEDVCLLESIDGDSAVKMHDLNRDMAIKIYDQEHGPAIIKAGVKLTNLLAAGKWGESLVTASLIENQIKEIPSRHSPRCPKLSTLLLPYNRELELIDETFFNQLHGLKILDLSHTVIVKLPDSVSNLVRLTTLLLIDCKKLVHVPSLEKLREMRRLDLYHTALENIPQGLECLSELRYLRMSNCGQKEFPGGILRELSHLQVFILGWGKYAPMTVKGEEVGCLENLEDLECHFNGHSDFVEFIKYRDQTHSLKTYKVRVGQFEENDDFLLELGDWGNNQIEENEGYLAEFGDCSNNYRGFQAIFPNYNQERINGECSGMESFVSPARFWSTPLPMPSNNGKFSCLKEFYCSGCKSMKKLFPLVFLGNLEVIEVSDCEKMVEIIETKSDDEGLIDEESGRSSRDDEGLIDEESSRSSRNTNIELPKLKRLKLIKLPELQSIFSAKLICNSLKLIHIINCEKLNKSCVVSFMPSHA